MGHDLSDSASKVWPRVTRIRVAGVVDYPPGSGYGPRDMQDNEWVWIIQGDVTYVRNGVPFAAPAGSVIWCRPGDRDAFEWDRKRTTRHAYIHFDLDRDPPSDTPVVTTLSGDDVINPLFRFLLRIGGTTDALATQAATTLLMAILQGQIQTRDVGLPSLPQTVQRTLEWMWQTLEREPRRKVSFPEIVRASGVTGEHLCRQFKKAIDLTPMQALRIARLDRALELVCRSDLSMKQIADATGFATPYHFSREFAKTFGKPPTAMRVQAEAGKSPPMPKLRRYLGVGV